MKEGFKIYAFIGGVKVQHVCVFRTIDDIANYLADNSITGCNSGNCYDKSYLQDKFKIQIEAQLSVGNVISGHMFDYVVESIDIENIDESKLYSPVSLCNYKSA